MSCQLAHTSSIVDWDSLILGQQFEINREKLVMFIDNPSIGKLLDLNLCHVFYVS